MAAIDGKWEVAVHTPFGDMKNILEVKEVEGKLEGTATENGEAAALQNGVINGNEFSYEVEIQSPFGAMKNTLKGVIDGDKLSGTSTTSFGDSKFDAVRL